MAVDPRLRFDNFVVGSANRLAVAAARAVGDGPGTVYNPLFIYSGSGLGKTHLLCAIGNHVAQRDPAAGVVLVTLEELVTALHQAIATRDGEGFKTRFMRGAVLLIDDVQFLTGHRETQNELLRMFNVLQANGKQIVMTSDRPPAEIADVDARLLTRLAGGLIVDVGPPDYETRMAILNAKCEERGVRFRGGVVEELARLEFRNVRELQGALNRLIAYQTLGGGEQIDPRSVPEILGTLGETRPRTSAPVRSGEFLDFLSGVELAVAQHVDQWKPRVNEAIAYWRSEGYRTGPLDRTLAGGTPPAGVESLLRSFESTITKLRDLERQAARIDAAVASHDAFRDPDRIVDAEQVLDRAQRGSSPPPGPSAAFTRAGFDVGTSNQLAVRAADAIVSDPATRYNPLFIHGPSGVGKTHLLNAIGHGLAANAVEGRGVACVPAQLFVDELIAALQDGTVDRWRERYRMASALLIDDVQCFAGKERTQEELFHVFNALHAAGKQIVLASDRAPRDLSGLEERLRSRFDGGLVVAMQSPDRHLRERLYSRFLKELGVEATAEMASYLGGRPVASVREIMGAANRIVASAEVKNASVSLAFMRSELEPNDVAAPRAAMAPAADSFFADGEKMLWHWPDASARLIEEFR
ncbi:MAG TPA: DnaA/Hda family protein [Gemmatimonadaceae bacterium]|nr:DnaA/Hda family protein [Gemmatimonadaceae bacterium]